MGFLIRIARPTQKTLSAAGKTPDEQSTTPDGRYFVVRGRLWRKSNPLLEEQLRATLVKQLMDARRSLRGKRPDEERAAARRAVQGAKQALGERGPVWWSDGAPDYNRHIVKNTPYAEWFESVGISTHQPDRCPPR